MPEDKLPNKQDYLILVQPKVSIIIPVFKAEKDIERCCKALFEQTLDSIEYIFVNDCTPDGSVAIIEKTLVEYPKRKSNVKILHQPQNMGVSACRQLGLDNATGEYVIHCDSDDWPDLDMYEILYDTAVKEEAEVVCCDYVVEYEGKSVVVRFPDKYNDRPSFNTGPIEGAVWNKLISKNLIKRIDAEFYQGVNLGEDFGFVTPCRVMSRKNMVVHKPMYHYNQLNLNSITHNYTKERFLQVVEVAKRMDTYLTKRQKAREYEKELCNLKFMSKMYFLIFSEVRDIKLWKSLFPECHKYILTYDVPVYLKLSAWFIANGMERLGGAILSLKTKLSGY